MNQIRKTTSSVISMIKLLVLTCCGLLFFTSCISESYPKEPDPSGFKNIKWSETITPEGIIKVTNEGGTTLGYSKHSGLSIVQVDGYAFKDLNRNNRLDKFEDWRLDYETRAKALADVIPVEYMMGMKMNPFGGWTVNADSLDHIMRNSLELGYRQLRAPRGGQVETKTKVAWNNMVQAYIESLKDMVCIPAVWIDDPRSGDVSNWPCNLGLAATFNPDIGAQYGRMMSEEWRAMGISMQVATQMDLATEPRWSRIPGTFGEDPALSMDMAQAIINGWQSTYDEEGNDLGWGEHSVNNQMKHFPGDGAAEGGRESHTRDGAYNVFPGGQFFTHILPFVACMDLPGKTKTVTAAMTNYSIGLEADGSPVGGERVGTSFSQYKISRLLREQYDWDGYILTDFGILTSKNYGVEGLTSVERRLAILEAGCDAFGGEGSDRQMSLNLAMKAYELGVDRIGKATMDEIMKKSTERILRSHFNVGIVDNPYLRLDVAESTANKPEHEAAAHQAFLKSVVMLKNEGNIIRKAKTGGSKPKVYVPRVYSAASGGWSRTPASARPGLDIIKSGEYFDVITDSLVEEFTGPADENGNPTLSENDIIRVSADKIKECDFAIVRISSPQNGNPTFDEYGGMRDDGREPEIEEQRQNYKYLPISLQYRPYTADSDFVRRESLGGDLIESTTLSTVGENKKRIKENRSYFGETGIITNEHHLELLLTTASIANKVIVLIDASGPMIFSEFEPVADAILLGFGGGRSPWVPDEVFLEVLTGQVEPTGLLPLQMPADMETVETQYEDIPRDMICHIDETGNVYDFAFGMDWSGVIRDERSAKYNVPPLVGEPPMKICY